jgi:hypothetical protein
MSYMNRTSMLDKMLDGMSHHEPNTAFDLPKNEHGKKVQHHDSPVRVDDKVDDKVDGKVVKSPIDIDALPPGVYPLV